LSSRFVLQINAFAAITRYLQTPEELEHFSYLAERPLLAFFELFAAHLSEQLRVFNWQSAPQAMGISHSHSGCSLSYICCMLQRSLIIFYLLAI
jgi:hypothetical protein